MKINEKILEIREFDTDPKMIIAIFTVLFSRCKIMHFIVSITYFRTN